MLADFRWPEGSVRVLILLGSFALHVLFALLAPQISYLPMFAWQDSKQPPVMIRFFVTHLVQQCLVPAAKPPGEVWQKLGRLPPG
jgi:hypothetical protein